MQPYFVPTRKTTSKNNGKQLLKKWAYLTTKTSKTKGFDTIEIILVAFLLDCNNCFPKNKTITNNIDIKDLSTQIFPSHSWNARRQWWWWLIAALWWWWGPLWPSYPAIYPSLWCGQHMMEFDEDAYFSLWVSLFLVTCKLAESFRAKFIKQNVFGWYRNICWSHFQPFFPS